MQKTKAWNIIGTILCISLMQLCTKVTGQRRPPVVDPTRNYKITTLPGQPLASFAQYSGFIQLDVVTDRQLFFYFVEAATSPDSKPIVLWLNGGPGCSSVGYGAFIEHGPFKVKGGGLINNDYSWNRAANILYLESPAGVGFSYSKNQSFYSKLNDDVTARDASLFLTRWFGIFSKYKKNDLYLAGESYAGHYVPQLAQLILGSSFNLKGIALGNPLLDFETDFSFRDKYYWSHGMISDPTYNLMNRRCPSSEYYKQLITSGGSTASIDCLYVQQKVRKEISDIVDENYVIADICLGTGKTQQSLLTHRNKSHALLNSVFGREAFKTKDIVNYDGADACAESDVRNYFNRQDVQTALHVQTTTGLRSWTACSEDVGNSYAITDQLTSMTDIIASLVKSGIRVLLYSGDQDAVLSFMGTRAVARNTARNLNLRTNKEQTVWLDDTNQAGGWGVAYSSDFIFVTVRGAGHVAPASQPERSYAMFEAFISGSLIKLES
ncbi:serine carboxypeptidase-like 45 [Rutidosis leptorrhynchoides]|uniref:serine carboxypeptidase-like 45 n=1 Tax=Rutidosis leptorrhynchoides TaxID=125765 RepID=UPI003A9914A6